MTVKIECNVCERFIKDVDPSKFSQLTGREICSECAGRIEVALVGFKKLKVETQKKLDDYYSEFMAEVVKVERYKQKIIHKINLHMDGDIAKFDEMKRQVIEGNVEKPKKEKTDGNQSRNVGQKNKNASDKRPSGNASIPKTKTKV